MLITTSPDVKYCQQYPLFVPRHAVLLNYDTSLKFINRELWLCCMLKQIVSSSPCDKRNNADIKQMLLLLAQNRCHCQWGTWSGKDWRVLFVWEATIVFVPDKWTTQ